LPADAGAKHIGSITMERPGAVEKRIERPAWLRYGAAMLLVVLASVLTNALQQWLWPTPLAAFYVAIVLAVWYGGLGPALLALGLSLPAIAIWAFQPLAVWSLGWSEVSRLITFGILSLLIIALSASRDRAEEALRGSERRFRTILETANEGIWLIDRDGRTQYANDRMAALLGTTSERIAAGTVLDFVFPEDVAAAREWISNTRAGGSEEFDFRFCRADGEEVLVVAGTSPVRDGSGQVTGALGLFTDVTARSEAEDALRLLDEAGRALASSLDYEQTLQRVAWLAVPALADWCMVDLLEDGVARRVAVAHADPQQAALAATLLRYSPSLSSAGPEEQVIRTGTSLYQETVTDELIEAAAQSAEHLEALRSIDVLSAIVAPLAAGGTVHGALTLFTTTISHRRFDEDDRALAEQLARRSAVAIHNARLYRDAQAAEARYRGLFEGTKDGIILFDHTGTCVDVNPAMTAMVGYDRTELVGRATTVVACGGPWTGEEGERLRRDGQWRGDFELRRKNGSLMPVESSITSVQLPTGSVYVGVLRDVSARRRFEQLQEEFLSALAHDLMNPLTSVRGQAQILRRRIARGEPLGEERLTAGLESIDVASTRMTRLLDELADVMRLRAGQEIDLRRESTDLVALARRTAAEQDRLTERHTIHVASTVDELIGFWDGPRLERVLGNLLGNAIKYSPDGGEITVRIAREGLDDAEVAVLSVEDRGVGIPAADLGHIFEPFRRAGNVESFAGSGIGLAGAKRIVELHGGTIAVKSREGQGSTFTVRLPIAANDQVRNNR
jgi:PAS domain S-box-containing protein